MQLIYCCRFQYYGQPFFHLTGFLTDIYQIVSQSHAGFLQHPVQFLHTKLKVIKINLTFSPPLKEDLLAEVGSPG